MDTKIYMAPMSGITDLAFRLIIRKLGAKQCFFEMLDANCMVHRNPAHKRILKTIKKDRPIAAQLLGADPSMMLDAAQMLIDIVDISSLDINSACPVKKVTKKGAGASLLNNTRRLGKIVGILASKMRIPVTVKLRTGFYQKDLKKCARTAKICQENGASTIFIHGRTMSQGYSGDIDYESIRAVKKALKIPVFGSGNIFNPMMAKKMLDKTGCDGILVARGALGNPWIFKDVANYLKTGKAPKKISLPAKKKILREHLAYIEKYGDLGHTNKIGYMGKVAMWYVHGLYNAAKLRFAISRAGSYQELLRLINSL